MPYVYSLRIGICPDFEPEEKLEHLLGFVESAAIDDVQFFLNMEEINDGHLTPEETEPWLEMLRSFAPRLKERGVTFSLNPWTTTLHADRGRRLKAGQNFVTMVDADGRSAQAVACPLCDNFRTYLSQMYSRYSELGCDIIWVEDDFRLLNHAPLKWGGCFCELHRKVFSERTGRTLSREDFVRGVLRPGEPHPYRRIWLDTAREIMTDLARLIGKAVHQVSPQTRVALMSSAPETHCVEGRDWQAVLKGLSCGNRPLVRPHLPAYHEQAGFRYCLAFQRYSRLTAAAVPENTELWPELDNLPHTTFSKSHAFARLQMESALSLCSEGITINIFDMTGNGVAECQENDRMLRGVKPYLDGVLGLGATRGSEQGVQVLFCPDSSYTLHAYEGDSLDAIRPRETFWAEYLSSFGIANVYTSRRRFSGEVVAVAGQYFRNLQEEELRALFADNTVLLNGDAIDTLVDMGCGDLIGVDEVEWLALNGGQHSYEQVTDGRTYHGLSKARMSAQAIDERTESGDYLRISYNAPVTEHSDLRTQTGRRAGPGLCRRDGVIFFPYGHLEESYMHLLNPVRREMLCSLLRDAPAGNRPAMALETQYVTVNHFSLPEGEMILLVNYATDAFERVVLDLPFAVESCCAIDRSTGKTVRVPWTLDEQGNLVLNCVLEALSSRCFLFPHPHDDLPDA